MMRNLRLSFLNRALREKLLLIVFLTIAVLWWGSAFARRAGQFWREQRVTSARLDDHTMWINNRAAIEAKARDTAAQFDRSRTLNANQLAAAVDQLANQAGLRDKAVSRGLTSRPTGQFTVHSFEYQINGAEWDRLLAFYRSLQARAPYIAIDAFRVDSQRNNPTQLSVYFRLVSVEINR